jgi:IclR family transcriptional regulator, KDG regulon repressor
MIKKEKSLYFIQAVGQALDVLEQFRDNVDELGITDLSRRLNLHSTKVFRLLATLELHNFVEQNKTTTNYRLGLKNLQLGQAFVKQTGLLRHARPVLESIVRKCAETAYISILKDFKTIYLDAMESELPVRVVTRVGTMLPFHCTAEGKVLAAGMNEKDLREYFERAELKRYTSRTIRDPDELTEHLRRIAELGFAVDDEELDEGVKSVSAPIRDYTKRVIGAVSVSGPSMRFTAERMDQELAPLVKKGAEELSARLGYK